MNRLRRKQEQARVQREQAEMQPALEASLSQRKAKTETIQAILETTPSTDMEVAMRQPVYTPPPAPGALPEGKRVFMCSVAGHVVATIVAISEEDARGLYEEELKARSINHVLGYDIREIGQGEQVVVHSAG